MASGHGGARPGSGRPRVTLLELVRERRFDWRNSGHRRALLEDELPLGEFADPVRVERVVVEYRLRQQIGDRSGASFLARSFAEIVRELVVVRRCRLCGGVIVDALRGRRRVFCRTCSPPGDSAAAARACRRAARKAAAAE